MGTRPVLAGFRAQWPVLKVEVAGFGPTAIWSYLCHARVLPYDCSPSGAVSDG
jgi:hypothetical protein